MGALIQHDGAEAGAGAGTDDVPAAGAGAFDQAVPVLVLTGFLGAGKTSVLNHLLTASAGLRIAAVVNDFGEIEVDAAQVAGRVDAMISLAGGCLCCEVEADEVTETLVALARAESRPDLVVIEASGLAEPSVLTRMVHDAPRAEVRAAGTVQVVDAEQLPELLGVHPRLAVHLAEADLVVVNKCDLVTPQDYRRVAARIREFAPRVPLVRAVRGGVPAGLLLAGAPGPDPARQRSLQEGHEQDHDCRHEGHDPDHDCRHEHLHSGYGVVTVRPTGPVHPRRLLEALSTPPPGAYRIKGELELATAEGPRRFRVETVGRRLEAEALPAAGPRGEAGVVVIGVDLPPEAADFLDTAVLAPGEEVDEAALWGLHPYLVADADASDVEEWIYDEDRSGPRTGAAGMLLDPEDPDVADPTTTA